ncbi:MULTISPECIES: glycosyltransferase family 2 protein [unclassified Amycolatopsis]|uniref:glycosyltransferase family 2 protein n=1 Tax=unclassified Amycolatopsis TaxID=2618356 RepID=UPI001EE895F8|nr:glycosyltransferase family 2 protein [Amycolatopsis sp. Poz14]MCG3748912.1 glycosyltransferase family 2 protein [Amycolatopsis sp. Poz14]
MAYGASAVGGRRPLLSLAMPIYNGERFLAQALDSICAQDLADWQLLICDNASSDGTEAIAKEYCALDSRISYVRHDRNLGAARNHNYGFHHTDGDYFAWVHGDNVYLPTYFSRCLEELRAHPEASCAHTVAVDIDVDGNRTHRWDENLRAEHPDVAVRFRDLTQRDHMCFAWFGVVNRDLLALTSLHASFDSADRLEIVELALHGPIRLVDEELFLHREHPGRIMRQAPTARSRYLILDPEWRGRIPFPVLNIGRQYALAVLRSRISPRDKVRCLLQMRGWLRTNWRRILRTVARGGYEYAKLAVRAGNRR